MSIKSDKAKKSIYTYSYGSFYVANEYAVSGTEKILLNSRLMNNDKEEIMSSNDEIKVILLSNKTYLVTSLEKALIIEDFNNEANVLSSVSRSNPGEIYKLSNFLNENGLIVLTDYSNEQKRNFEYLYDFKTGKRISCGFDSIDEVDGKLRVTFGIATGILDLEGNFIMDSIEGYANKPKTFLDRLFNRS